MATTHYDILVVGAGIAGSALAHALSTITSKLRPAPLRIALLERSLAEPDRIVGELLQPGGVAALQKLGLESCLEGIDAIPTHGYCVVRSGQIVHIPYPDGRQGRSFHHGRFIMALRERAKRAAGVDVIEATANELIECQHTNRVLGVRATRSSAGDTSGSNKEKESFFADLVVIADGCFSNFRSAVMGKALRESPTKSYFCGAILKDTRLPMPEHGTVALVQGHGPVLLYQISEHDTRMLVDVKAPVPHDLKMKILLSCREAALSTSNVVAHASVNPSLYWPGKSPTTLLSTLCRRTYKSLYIRIAPSPFLLAYHFFYVAFYSIWVMFMHPRAVHDAINPDKPRMVAPSIGEYPGLAVKSINVVSHVSPHFPVLDGLRRLWTSTLVGGTVVVKII
ncbi:hypothetical protein ID866_9455 [Astraeus odoratus]|nr:hypothetical protein ID866_9455 [Astraeus odoratus]